MPSGETVAEHDVQRRVASPSTAGLVKVTAAAGANIVTFENEPVGPPQTGYIEVCKDAGDDYVAHTTTPFTFTITDRTNVAVTVNVLAGQCSGPIQVAAGNVNVAETQDGTTFVSSIWTAPDPSTLGPTNLSNGTATVVVPVSADTSGEVQVHFENTTVTATLKVCKVLTAGSDALAGQPFSFRLEDAAGTQVVTLIAVTGPYGACKIVREGDGILYKGVPGQADENLLLPVGSTVTATEELDDGFPYIKADGPQTVTVVGGVNIDHRSTTRRWASSRSARRC